MLHKNALKSWLAAFALAAVFAGCQKDDVSPDNPDDPTTQQDSTASSKENALAESIWADVWAVTDEAARGADGIKSTASALACATVTIDTTSSPKTITIDFDSLGCVSNDGRMRQGIIFATFSGRYRSPGTLITATLINYYVDGYAVEGTKSVTNNGYNSNGNLWYTIEVDSARITDTATNAQISWESTRYREWVEDTATWWNPFDDVYLITGVASGVNVYGIPYTVEITTPLRVEIGCPWITEGQLEVRPQGFPIRYVDYGNGVCDRQATITINGVAYNITM